MSICQRRDQPTYKGDLSDSSLLTSLSASLLASTPPTIPSYTPHPSIRVFCNSPFLSLGISQDLKCYDSSSKEVDYKSASTHLHLILPLHVIEQLILQYLIKTSPDKSGPCHPTFFTASTWPMLPKKANTGEKCKVPPTLVQEKEVPTHSETNCIQDWAPHPSTINRQSGSQKGSVSIRSSA
ncbi:hypothetical protein B0H10DRAFT_1942184 [Mycena sp. CBHHK59/15]|nr:hypothetical protein B0H10DRAFT_1942184 [Mycena sp. CBHHK59/15]